MRRLAIVVSVALVASASTFAVQSHAARAPVHCKTVTKESKRFRFCTGLALSKDRTVKLETHVTLPGKGDGPFPLIVLLHGLGGQAKDFDSDTIEGSGFDFHRNNLWFASRGYAVLNYTARGFYADVCVNESVQAEDGIPDVYPPSPACRPQLDSIDYEVKDTQDLVGRLVDGALVDADVSIKPGKVGVFGVSYGGGHTWLLTRHNTWKSPYGTKIRLAAAVPNIAWTDLLDALLPNGRARDDVVPDTNPAVREAQPIGVFKKSTVDAFALLLNISLPEGDQFKLPGYLSSWLERARQGEPYGDGIVQDFVHKAVTERSAYYVEKRGAFETPILAQNGFTDFPFTVVQTLQMYNRLLQEDPAYPISLQFGDFGHPIAQNKFEEIKEGAELTNVWFDHYLKGKGANPSGFVQARLTDCAGALGALYRGTSWQGLQTDDEAFALTLAGDLVTPNFDVHADSLDPITEPRGVCRKTDTQVKDGNLSASVTLADGMTMLGLPEIQLDANPSAADMYVAARVWDVDPSTDSQTLVTRGVYRLGAAVSQHVAWQLFGNGYTFAPGHSLKLELTADDSPSFQRSSGSGTIAISNVSLSVPRANQGALVTRP